MLISEISVNGTSNFSVDTRYEQMGVDFQLDMMMLNM